MNKAQLINQDSGEYEWYTPSEIIEAAWRTMGSIDLDPASSATANLRVKANAFFTKEDDGLSEQWYGNVWLNHPFGRGSNALWIHKIEEEFKPGCVDQICCITFAATSERWFQPLLRRPQCFLSPRTNYFLPDGSLKTGVTKGSVVTYYGPNVAAFAREFKALGVVKGVL